MDIVSEIMHHADIITFTLALIGFVGTVSGWIYFWLTTKRNIDLELFDYGVLGGSIAQFFIHFQNQSHFPICIISVSLLHDNSEICCELIPMKVRSIGEDLLRTPSFPINLVGRQGYLCFLEFAGCGQIQLAPGNKVALSINTNRGRIRRSVTLSNTSHYLHIG